MNQNFKRDTVDVADFVTLASVTMELTRNMREMSLAVLDLQKRVAKLEKEALR